MSVRSPTKPPFYSIDVLTDGSEHTGDGTLFLSVWKSEVAGTSSWHDRVATNKLLARYAITGLGDSLARLAADQRFKLNSVRAVFCSSSAATWGLPALNMALNGAGAARVSIVSTLSQQIESVLSLLESHRKNPTVHLCQVPSTTTSENNGDNTWWEVYQDEYLVVHAQRLQSGKTGSDDKESECRVIFLYSLLQVEDQQPTSFLVLPPDFQPLHLSTLVQAELPLLPNDTPVSLFLGIALRPNCPVEQFSVLKDHPTMVWYTTEPSNDTVDPGILVRALHQSRLWNAASSTHFPLAAIDNPTTHSNPGRLRSGTSLVLRLSPSAGNASSHVVVDRQWTPKEDSTEEPETPAWLADAIQFSELSSQDDVEDENEIDLDDEDEADVNETAAQELQPSCRAKLLVLGTGCASPSPYRGASGFGLLLPHDQTVVFEVGEGFVAQWNRHAEGRRLSTIKIIWISHAHWDHYGGIVPLLTALRHERHGRTPLTPNAHSAKRVRGNEELPPWVIASTKVLSYLDRMLKDNVNDYCRRIPHEDRRRASSVFCELQSPTESSRPIVFWETIRVDHSCASAYGFVMGLRLSAHEAPFVFCFSGDTRPCWRLVQACRDLTARYGGSSVDFLLHEATFDEAETEMSATKKHSTVQEALQVAKDTQAKRVLLTHFSQRYKGSLNVDADQQGRVGLALDGMSVPLFE